MSKIIIEPSFKCSECSQTISRPNIEIVMIKGSEYIDDGITNITPNICPNCGTEFESVEINKESCNIYTYTYKTKEWLSERL